MSPIWLSGAVSSRLQKFAAFNRKTLLIRRCLTHVRQSEERRSKTFGKHREKLECNTREQSDCRAQRSLSRPWLIGRRTTLVLWLRNEKGNSFFTTRL